MKNFEKGLILVEDNKLEEVAGGMQVNPDPALAALATPATPATPVAAGVTHTFKENYWDFHKGLIWNPKGVLPSANGNFFTNRIQAAKSVFKRMPGKHIIGTATIDGGAIGGATVIGVGAYLVYDKCFRKKS